MRPYAQSNAQHWLLVLAIIILMTLLVLMLTGFFATEIQPFAS